jgi:HEAT repeat protein
MGDTLTIPHMIKALQNEKSYSVKYKAYNALSNFPDPRVVDVMVSALSEENMVIRGFASTTLMHFGKLAVPGLIEATKNENLEIKWNACIILGEIGDKSAIEPLNQLLNNTSTESDTAVTNPIIKEALRKIYKRNK